MDETISDQRQTHLCWVYSTARMWTRLIQNVTDEFAFTKQGNLKCNTYYDSDCLSYTFRCFDRKSLSPDCEKDNEKVDGLSVHGLAFLDASTFKGGPPNGLGGTGGTGGAYGFELIV